MWMYFNTSEIKYPHIHPYISCCCISVSDIGAFYGFTAVMRNNKHDPRKGRRLQFPTVLFNHGNAYNARTGQFSCPVSGYYVFFTTIMSHENAESAAHVYVDGRKTLSAFASFQKSHGQSSAMVLARCLKGQSAELRSFAHPWNRFWDNEHGYSTFSGWLLRKN